MLSINELTHYNGVGGDFGRAGRAVGRLGQVGLIHGERDAENRFLLRRRPRGPEGQVGGKSPRQRTGDRHLRHQVPVGHGQISHQTGAEYPDEQMTCKNVLFV